jgi:hypothetical protein
LTLGDNAVHGTAHFGTATDALDYDADAFGFIVPPGTAVVPGSIRFAYDRTALYGPLVWLGTGFRLGAGTAFNTNNPIYSTGSRFGPALSIFSDGSFDNFPGYGPAVASPVELSFSQILDSEVNTNFPAPALAPGLYWLSQDEFLKVGSLQPPTGGTWNYTVTITLTAIPEPNGPSLLMLAGVLLFGFVPHPSPGRDAPSTRFR